MKSIAVLSVALLVSCINAGPVQPKDGPQVTVGLFYDVFDETSISLIRAQNRSGVWDLMQKDSTELAMNFNPLGSASESNGVISCPKDEDCHATKLQACAIKMHQDSDVAHHEIFYFILCTAIHDNWQSDPDTTVNECITEVGTWPDDGESIEICSKGEEIKETLATMLKEVKDKGVNKVPWVTINDKRNEAAESDLLAGVCGAFDGEKPAACSGATGAPGNSTDGPDDNGSGAAELVSSKVFHILLLVLAIFGFK